MTKIRTSAYAVRCRVPSDHRHPGGARTYNDNSGQCSVRASNRRAANRETAI